MTLSVAVVGATGAVGRELIDCVESSSLSVGRLMPLASERSAGRTLPFRDGTVVTERLSEDNLRDHDVVFFAAGASISREWARKASSLGAFVVDNSSAFRLDDDVPLVVPEINAEALSDETRLVANPNCSTIICLMAVAPLHRRFGVSRLIAATYQAASGAGAEGMDELRTATRAYLDHRSHEPSVFGADLGFNVIPWIGAGVDGGTDEELKMLREGRKILGHEGLEVACTCVRVPVERTHGIAATVLTERPAAPSEIREVLSRAPGVTLHDASDPAGLTPRAVAGRDEVVVGRVRSVFGDASGISFFVLGDQLRKGAALNAVQIAEWAFGESSS